MLDKRSGCRSVRICWHQINVDFQRQKIGVVGR